VVHQLTRYCLPLCLAACALACDEPTHPLSDLANSDFHVRAWTCNCWSELGHTSEEACEATFEVRGGDRSSCQRERYAADTEPWVTCRAASAAAHFECIQGIGVCNSDAFGACLADRERSDARCGELPSSAAERWAACEPTADRDSDGVPNIDDSCPDEPASSDGAVDEDGCPDGRYGPCAAGCEEGDACLMVEGSALCTRACASSDACPPRNGAGACLTFEGAAGGVCLQRCGTDADCEASSRCVERHVPVDSNAFVCLP